MDVIVLDASDHPRWCLFLPFFIGGWPLIKKRTKNILNIIHNYKIKIKLNSGSGDTDYNIIEVVGFFVD